MGKQSAFAKAVQREVDIQMGFDYVGCEIDKDYFEKEEERFREHSMQINLFLGG